jgi:hypothetical protein
MACGAVFAIEWRPGCKSLLFPQRRTHSSLVCMCMACGAVCAIAWRTACKSLLFLQRSAALTAHSCVCAWYAALSLSSHGEQHVSLCSSCSAAQHSELTRVYVYGMPVIALRTGCKSVLFPQRSTQSSLVCMCTACLPSHGDQQVSLCTFHSATLTAHSCVCAWHWRCICHRMATRL